MPVLYPFRAPGEEGGKVQVGSLGRWEGECPWGDQPGTPVNGAVGELRRFSLFATDAGVLADGKKVATSAPAPHDKCTFRGGVTNETGTITFAILQADPSSLEFKFIKASRERRP